jgi:hypothetical protein
MSNTITGSQREAIPGTDRASQPCEVFGLRFSGTHRVPSPPLAGAKVADRPDERVDDLRLEVGNLKSPPPVLKPKTSNFKPADDALM